MVGYLIGSLIVKDYGSSELTRDVDMIVGRGLHPVEILIVLSLEIGYGQRQEEPD